MRPASRELETDGRRRVAGRRAGHQAAFATLDPVTELASRPTLYGVVLVQVTLTVVCSWLIAVASTPLPKASGFAAIVQFGCSVSVTLKVAVAVPRIRGCVGGRCRQAD